MNVESKINQYVGHVQDFSSEFWKNPIHKELYLRAMESRMDPTDADRYIALVDLVGKDITIDEFREANVLLSENDIEILEAKKEPGNVEWETISDLIEQMDLQSIREYREYRNSIIKSFRNKTDSMFHSIEGISAHDLELAIWNYVQDKLKKENLDVEILNVVLTGSRARGLEQNNSDIDFVLEYMGDIKEDFLFNVLHNENIRINNLNFPIDINPIRSEETGPLEQYLPRVEEYLQSKLMDKDLLNRCTNAFATHGYPIYIGDTHISFPEEYDDLFTSEELNRLQNLLIEKKQLAKEKTKEADYKESFGKAVDEWDKNDIRHTFKVSRTSAAMDLIGIENKEITLDAVKLKRIIKTHPDMSIDIIKQIPDVIDDPVLIMNSKQSNSRIVVSGELYDLNNKAVVVILELEPKDKNGLVLDEIKVASAYGKKNLDNMILSSRLLYVTEDKEKINRWIKNTGLQLPFDLSSIDSISIISQDNKNATVEYKENSTEVMLERHKELSDHATWKTRMDDIASDIAWKKQSGKAQKGENKMGKDNPISVWVGNLRKYNEGNLEGKWIDLPIADEELQRELAEISAEGRDEIMIFDQETREDCQYMHDVIHEFDSIYELNVVAKLIGNEPHPAVEMYFKYDDNLSLSEIANLIYKEDEISYSPYEFDGVDNSNALNVLSNEEKLGYTILESNKSLKATLEGLDIDGTSIMNFINVEAIGRDMVLSDYVTVGENGFLDNRYITIDLEEYSIEEINQEINEHVEMEKKQNHEVTQKIKHISEPTPVGPKL